MKWILPCALALAIGNLAAREDEGLATRHFTLPERFFVHELDRGRAAQTLLEENGVFFGEGESARFLKAENGLEVTNRPDDLILAEAVVSMWERIIRDIEEPARLAELQKTGTKIREIIIPSVEFSETPLQEALAQLEKDSETFDPDGEGIRISVETLEEFTNDSRTEGDTFGFEAGEGGNGVLSTPVTLRLSNVPLSEALRYTFALAQLRYHVSPGIVKGVFFHHTGEPLETRGYRVPENFLKTLTKIATDSGTPFCEPLDPFQTKVEGGKKTDDQILKELLETMGIAFPYGSEVRLLESLNLFVAKNGLSQLQLIEVVLEMTDAKAPHDWIDSRVAVMNEKLDWITLPAVTFDDTGIPALHDHLSGQVLRLDTASPVADRGMIFSIRFQDEAPPYHWEKRVTHSFPEQTLRERVEDYANVIDATFEVSPHGVVFSAKLKEETSPEDHIP